MIAVVALVFAALCVVARIVWEVASPLHFDTVKTYIYVRDVVTLGPATIAALFGIAKLGPTKRSWAWATEHPRRVVALLSVFTAVLCATICNFVLLGVPHVVDEAAYLWQAKLIEAGKLATVPGPASSATGVEYVGDIATGSDLAISRVSAFFPGSSLPLAFGDRLGLVTLVNPLLAGALVAVTYWCGRRLFDTRVALISAALFSISPFVLFQGASFFGQVWTALFLAPAVALAIKPKRFWEPPVVGLFVGVAMFSRPVSAVVAAVVIGIAWLVQGKWWHRPARLAGAVVGGLVPAVLFLAMNEALTGDRFQTAHRLLLPDETANFDLHWVRNAALNIAGLLVDFNGLVIVGMLALVPALIKRSKPATVVVAYLAAQIGAYSLYYNHGISYGPRYLFELMPLLIPAAAFGLTNVSRLADRLPRVLAIAAAVSLIAIVPTHSAVFHARGEYLSLADVDKALAGQRAVVFMTSGPYEFPDPFYPAFVHNGARVGSTDVVYVRDLPGQRCLTASAFPGRQQYLLDMDMRADKHKTGSLKALSSAC